MLLNIFYFDSLYSQNDKNVFPEIGTNFIMAKAKIYPKLKLRIDDLGQNDWDITEFNPDDFDTLRFKKPEKTRYGKRFPNAEVAIVTNSYNMQYIYQDSGKVFVTGLIGDFMEINIPVLLQFKEKMLFKNKEQSIDNEYINVATTSFASPYYHKPGTDSIRADITLKRTARVDSRGYLNTQLGKFKAYREVSFYEKRVRGYKFSLFGWTPANEYSLDKHYTVYRWYDENGGGMPLAVAYINDEDYVEEIHYQYNSSLRLFFSSHHVSCKNGSDGKVDLTVRGGIPDYTYEWSNNETVEDLIDIKAGTYRVKVTDNRGSSITASYTVTEPLVALNVKFNKKDISCKSAKNGEISIKISGGKFPYDFDWANDSINDKITNLKPGFYSVFVKDANGCFLNDSIEILEPEKKLSAKLGIKNISCYNGNDGQITINAEGGTSPYIYKCSTGDTAKIIKNLKTGNYSVLVTDKNNCTYSTNAFINQPQTEIKIVKDISNVSCFNGNDGKIELLVRGGKPPYDYLWNDESTKKSLKNISKGIYKFKLTDNNNCIIEDSVLISQPSEPLIVTCTKEDVKCFGDNSGKIDIIVKGGTPEYQYIWLNGETKNNLRKLTQGKYTIKIVDKNLCQTYDTINILSPENPLFAEAEQKNVKCAGGFDGQIKLAVSGGTEPYSFLWSNKSNNQELINLKKGKYNVKILDKNNCELDKEYIITEPEKAFNVDVEKSDIKCFNSKSGSIYLNPTGGIPPYTFEWSNSKNIQNLIGIEAGKYSVCVTDNNNCKKVLNIEINQPKNITIEAQITNSENDKQNGSIVLTISGGLEPYKILWDNGEKTEKIENLKNGTYEVTITDSNNCETYKSFELKNTIQP